MYAYIKRAQYYGETQWEAEKEGSSVRTVPENL